MILLLKLTEQEQFAIKRRVQQSWICDALSSPALKGVIAGEYPPIIFRDSIAQ